MEENKSNWPFPSSSPPPPPPPITPHSDQNPPPVSSIDHETLQLFSSFCSGDWTNNVVLEQSPLRIENSLAMVVRENNVNRISLLANQYNSYSNFETTQYYYSSSTLSTTHNNGVSNHPIEYTGLLSNVVNFNSAKTTSESWNSLTFKNLDNFDSSLYDPFLNPNPETTLFCSPSTISMTHNNDLSSDPIGYTGLLSDVVNFDSAKTTSKNWNSMTFKNWDNFDSSLYDPFLNPNHETTQFCSSLTISTTNNNDLSYDPIGYTGLLSDVVNFDSTKTRPPVPALSYSPKTKSSLPLLPPPPRALHNSLKIKENNSKTWSIEEHKLFLAGMHFFGKGDWRNIANNVVITRTNTQVASHAQKYFFRQTLPKDMRKRSSIHDITTVDPQFLSQVQARLSLRNINVSQQHQ